jgi:CHAT domain-containing protein/tetratricopeptide (TPR) repeat protein
MTMFPPSLLSASVRVEAESLSTAVEELRFAGRYDEALETAQRLAALVRGDSTFPAWVRNDVAGSVRALERIQALPPGSREELAGAHRLQAVAATDFADGRYAEGAAATRRQLEIFRRILGENDFDTGVALNNLAAFLHYQGDVRGAERYYSDALAVFRRVRPGEHPQVLQTLNNMAALVILRGDFAAAEPLYREIVSVQHKLTPVDDGDTALYLQNLGRCLSKQGSISEARSCLREAVRIYRGLAGHDPDVARCLTVLGNLALSHRDFSQADSLLEEARVIEARTLRPDHPDLGETLFVLGQVWHERTDRRDLVKAEDLYNRALQIKRIAFGDHHQQCAAVQYRLGSLRAVQGRFAEAESLLNAARITYSLALGEEHPFVAWCLQQMAAVEYYRRLPGDLSAAEAHALRAGEIFEQARRRAGLGMARAAFQVSPYAVLGAIQLDLGRKENAWESAEHMQARALFDLLSAAKRRAVSPQEAAREDSLEQELTRHERRVSVLRQASAKDTSGGTAGQLEVTRTHLLAAEAAWKRYQQEISLKYPAAEGRGYALARVQRSLSPETALVGWLDIETFNGGVVSWGYVVRSRGPVGWARIGPDSVLTRKKVRAWRELLTSASSPPEPRHSLSQKLWAQRVEPLTPWLGGAGRLIVIPSGAMVGAPVEALEDPHGRTLGDLYKVSYIPSATLHAWLREGQARPQGGEVAPLVQAALLVGDPVFRPPAGAAVAGRPKAPPHPSVPIPTVPIQRGDSPDRGPDATGARTLSQLPWTRAEVQGVAPLWRERTVLLGPDASEQTLVRLAGTDQLARFRVLHFATHALVDDDRPEASALALSSVAPVQADAAGNGGLGCDGFVTVQEILREWRLEAELVTLSACNSGLGREVLGEGYVGLAHAFLQVGARCLLVSLWPVDDRSAALLMRRFYENWVGTAREERDSGLSSPDSLSPSRRAPPTPAESSPGVASTPHAPRMSKADALQEAKSWLRRYAGPSGVRCYTHPYFWAGFVLLGDAD